ncbi:hypothetical protein FDP41_004791 [Naegleria fowleri]|uniref:Carboxylic ester hydrolase n=1 Tax=Naegleria fowleri TaxID=5763 RepID=A0A6A5BMG5_NAEFO|nr:uncharacterized protein FDP41_004791 [Naegleria fowleri]KAF0976116.1 hypothetical protein FDP41_004791 [Naegleria fowleri]
MLKTTSNILLILVIVSLLLVTTVSTGATVVSQQELPSSQPTVTLSNGATLRGVFSENNQVKAFLGVRYAMDTSGANRWQLPQPYQYPANSLNDVRNFSKICPQPVESILSSFDKQSEDCLFLNVWSPVNASISGKPQRGKLPVFFWIHGGQFLTGSGAFYAGGYLCDQSNMMGRPMIVVSINYRLGALGFYSDTSSQFNFMGNYGLWDIIESLKWVRANIETFGGDPLDITIAGESAGGIAVSILLTSPLFKSNEHQVEQAHIDKYGRISKAIIQSGVLPNNILQKSLSEAQVYSTLFKSRVSCSDPACMRALPFTTIVEKQNQLQMGAVVDGMISTEPILQLIAKNSTLHNIPLLIGTNLNETNLFLCRVSGADTMNIFQLLALTGTVLNFKLPTDNLIQFASNLYRVYGPVTNYKSTFDFFKILTTDVMFQCPSLYLARLSTAFISSQNTFKYVFKYVHPALNDCYGASHASELPYLFPSILDFVGRDHGMFKNASAVVTATMTPTDIALSKMMIYYWSNFVKYGNPNGIKNEQNSDASRKEDPTTQHYPIWPNYECSAESQLVIDTPELSIVNNHTFTNVCQFWNGLLGFSTVQNCPP